jgi:hypothetical protein
MKKKTIELRQVEVGPLPKEIPDRYRVDQSKQETTIAPLLKKNIVGTFQPGKEMLKKLSEKNPTRKGHNKEL